MSYILFIVYSWDEVKGIAVKKRVAFPKWAAQHRCFDGHFVRLSRESPAQASLDGAPLRVDVNARVRTKTSYLRGGLHLGVFASHPFRTERGKSGACLDVVVQSEEKVGPNRWSSPHDSGSTAADRSVRSTWTFSSWRWRLGLFALGGGRG
jgi:hypothetical protein